MAAFLRLEEWMKTRQCWAVERNMTQRITPGRIFPQWTRYLLTKGNFSFPFMYKLLPVYWMLVALPPLGAAHASFPTCMLKQHGCFRYDETNHSLSPDVSVWPLLFLVVRQGSTFVLLRWMDSSMCWVGRMRTLKSSSQWKYLTLTLITGQPRPAWLLSERWERKTTVFLVWVSCLSHIRTVLDKCPLVLFFSSVAALQWRRSCMSWEEGLTGKFMTRWNVTTPRLSNGLHSAL